MIIHRSIKNNIICRYRYITSRDVWVSCAGEIQLVHYRRLSYNQNVAIIILLDLTTISISWISADIRDSRPV